MAAMRYLVSAGRLSRKPLAGWSTKVPQAGYCMAQLHHNDEQRLSIKYNDNERVARLIWDRRNPCR